MEAVIHQSQRSSTPSQAVNFASVVGSYLKDLEVALF